LKKEIYPNTHLGAKAVLPTIVEGDQLPLTLNRISRDRFRHLMNYANIQKGQTVLEMFAGSNMGTAILAKRLIYADRLTALDLHYGFETGVTWRYVWEENYPRQAKEEGVRSKKQPHFIAADARDVPLKDRTFDCILAPDSPRISTIQTWQKDLFVVAALEARRLLKEGGTFAATCYPSWAEVLKYIFRDIEMQGEELVTVRCKR
jgi:ubiquinone/menaquinone biosynthesis C-methylase UbiE